MKTLDTRDLYKRKWELEELRDAVTSAKEELEELTSREEDPEEIENYWEQHERLTGALDSAEEDFGTDEQEELAELENLEDEIGFRTFKDGETMIHESDFQEYAQDLAEDIGAIPADMRWPCTCIDWEKAAEELKGDYTEVTYQGDTYLVRA